MRTNFVSYNQIHLLCVQMQWPAVRPRYREIRAWWRTGAIECCVLWFAAVSAQPLVLVNATSTVVAETAKFTVEFVVNTLYVLSEPRITNIIFVITVYDVLTGVPVVVLTGHSDCVRDVSWHPYSNEIIDSAVTQVGYVFHCTALISIGLLVAVGWSPLQVVACFSGFRWWDGKWFRGVYYRERFR